MKEAYYFHNDTVILNYSKKYFKDSVDLVNSDGFKDFLTYYLESLRKHHHDLYVWILSCFEENPIEDKIISIFKLLLIMDIDEIHHPFVKDTSKLLEFIEEGYNDWRKLQRYSFLYTHNEEGYQIQSFIEADSVLNSVVIKFYRLVEEKAKRTKNKVYRQLQAGTNASFLLQYYDVKLPKEYAELEGIPFVNSIMLRTPLILHPRSNKRTNKFVEHPYNPIRDFKVGDEEWIVYPARVGSLLVYAYFHRNYVSSCASMANLFELASMEDAMRKPDAIMLFGNPDGTKDTVFYHDVENHIWVGKVSESPEIDYFGYTKKMILTLHNLAMIQKGWLPIHGAMVNMYLKDGTKKGLLFMGDSGAGKSETIEALSELASDLIDHQETVFDDMGSVHIDEDGHIRAQGTEIGAFVRLDDLDKGTAYKDMDRSIFFNPEKSNARVVLPAAPIDVVTTNQKIDCFLYANNYTDKRGMHIFDSPEEAKQVFVEGKRFALGTTQENGLSTTFFANPFGPMQKQDECSKLIDKMFAKLFEENIPVGEIYTCLGLENKGDRGINKAAESLLEFVKQK